MMRDDGKVSKRQHKMAIIMHLHPLSSMHRLLALTFVPWCIAMVPAPIPNLANGPHSLPMEFFPSFQLCLDDFPHSTCSEPLQRNKTISSIILEYNTSWPEFISRTNQHYDHRIIQCIKSICFPHSMIGILASTEQKKRINFISVLKLSTWKILKI